ncbi:MAG: hypothetical protein MZW92_26030 [Comamonadaceae bacterium]|nr:hypothetical protein [Comamonadaceae bacterium]
MAWIASPETARTNVLYVAPTRQLLAQTERSIQEALAAAPGLQVRNVHRITSDTTETGRVQVEAVSAVNEAEEGDGLVQLLATQTFLAVLAGIRHPERWSVILDEAFAPATFQAFQLGADALRGWEHFSELFEVDPAQGHRIVPKAGRQTVVEAVARGDFSSAGDRAQSLREVAQGVANKAVRCELVLTDGARAVLEGMAPKKRGKDATGTALQFASYVDPQAFAGFGEVLFLSALFEQTVLYHLWTKALGVHFEEHPKFPAHMLQDTHAAQGRFLAVGHLLHKDDNASIDTLQRDALSGQPGHEAPGARVIDHIVQTAAGHFEDEPFPAADQRAFQLLGWVRAAAPAGRSNPDHEPRAQRLPGLRQRGSLAVTNPNPQQLSGSAAAPA